MKHSNKTGWREEMKYEAKKRKKEKVEDWGKDPNLETESRYQSSKFGSNIKPRKKPLNQKSLSQTPTSWV